MNNIHVEYEDNSYYVKRMNAENEFGWKEPTQERSRARVQRMLEAALELAVEEGKLDFAMTAVAKRADVPIGTLYQFFPTKTALIGKLFAEEMKPIDNSIAAVISDGLDLSQFADRIEKQLSQQIALVRTRPGLALIWSSPAVDPVIQAADYKNTQKNAKTLTDELCKVLPPSVAQSDIQATALLVCHLWSSVVRLCVLSNKKQSAMLCRQYAKMIASHGQELIRKATHD